MIIAKNKFYANGGFSQIRSPIVTHRKCIAKYMTNPRISADWCTTKPISPLSCTSGVQEVHTKYDVVYLTPVLLDLGVSFNSHA